jgi:hypothetical protein
MADDRRKDGDTGLDALFAEARRVTPDDDLVARVLADARAVQDAAAPAMAAPRLGVGCSGTRHPGSRRSAAGAASAA